MSHDLTVSGKKHSFKDSQTKMCFYIKKPRWNIKSSYSRHKKHQSSLQNKQLTWVSCLNLKLFKLSQVINPVTNRFFKKEEKRGEKKKFSRRMKTLRRELRTFSPRILCGYSSCIWVLGKNYFFTVQVNKSLSIFEIVEC